MCVGANSGSRCDDTALPDSFLINSDCGMLLFVENGANVVDHHVWVGTKKEAQIMLVKLFGPDQDSLGRRLLGFNLNQARVFPWPIVLVQVRCGDRMIIRALA